MHFWHSFENKDALQEANLSKENIGMFDKENMRGQQRRNQHLFTAFFNDISMFQLNITGKQQQEISTRNKIKAMELNETVLSSLKTMEVASVIYYNSEK